MRPLVGASCALVLLLAVVKPAHAGQASVITVDLTGRVLDPTGAGSPGAEITAVHQETGIRRVTTSGPDGQFLLPALPVGPYTVTASRAGFWPAVSPEITLTVGQQATLEFRLTPSTVDVTVVAEPEARFDTAPGSDVITRDLIERLPTNGRHFVASASLLPGVSDDRTPQQGASRTSGLSFSGQRARSNNIMVDGLDNNDETVGSVRALFSLDAVQEFQVLSGIPPAEFGKASGGTVNLVTRSGTDVVSGGLFGYFRDRALNRMGHFERFTPAGERIERPKAPFSQWQYGGTLGGPIRALDALYFLSFERADVHAANFVTIDDRTAISHPLNPALTLGTPAGILRDAGFPVDVGNVGYAIVLNQFLAKLERQTGRHWFGGRLNTATELNENVEPFGGQVARSRAAALESTDVMVAGYYNRMVSPRTLSELRGQVARRDQLVRSLDPRCGSCLDETAGGPTLEVTGVASAGRQRFTPTLRDNTRYQLAHTLSAYRGAHAWRTGVDLTYIDGRRQSLPLHFGGRYIFQSVSLPLVPSAPPVPVTAIQAVALGLPVAYVQGYGSSGAASDFGDLAAFVQDTWTVSDALTLNAGLRYQTQFWPVSRQTPAGYPGTYRFPSDRNDFAPRLAAAWRPGGGSKTVIRAGYGVYHDSVLTAVFGITKYINGTDGLRTMVLRAPGAFAAWAAPGHQLPETLAEQLAGGRYPSLAITIDPSLATPYAHHSMVGAERQLSGRMSIAAELLHVRGFNQIGTIDYNPIVAALGPGRRPADLDGIAGTSASVLQYTSFGETWYRGLRLSLRGSPAPGSEVLASYTLARSEDNSTDFQTSFLPQNNGVGRNPDDPDGLPLAFDPDSERGPAIHDERHRLVLMGSYLAPRGVQLAGLVTFGSGYPYNIVAGADLNGDGDGGSPSPDRPRRDPSDPASSIGRNAGRLPARLTVDLRVSRRLSFGGRISIEPTLEIFNLFNRTNFTDAQHVFGTGAYPTNPVPTFGQFTQAGPPRQAQLAITARFQ